MLLGSLSSFGQATGTLTVPSTTYPTLDSAIKYLNKVGVGTGGVTVNVTANQTQTGSVGYMLGSATLNASTSATKRVTINGNGNTVTAFTGASTSTDGMFEILGTDYVTIDGLNLAENSSNTTGTTQMEWGYALVKRNATAPVDGCQFVTIKNCTITLNKSNTASVGIYLNNHIATNTTGLTTTATDQSDANSNNLFQNNIIQNVTRGVQAFGIGVGSAVAVTLYDFNNQIVGNTIQNFSTTTTSYGVYTDNNTNLVIRGNTINNVSGGGSTSTSIVYGVNQLGNGTNAKINSNSINVGGSSTQYCIYSNASGDSLSTDSNSVGFSGTSSGTMYGIYTPATAKFVTMNANSFSNASIPGSGTLYCFYPAGATQAGGSFSMNDNKITNITRPSGSSYLFYQTGSIPGTVSYSVRRNKVSNFTASSGSIYAFYCYGGGSPSPVKYFEYDTVDNVTSSSSLYCLYTYYLGAGSQIANNYFNNITLNGLLYGVYISSTGSASYDIHDNVMKGITNNTTSSTNYMYYVSSIASPGGAPVRFYKNLMTDVQVAYGSTTAVLYPLYSAVADTIDAYNNVISDLRTPTASGVNPLYGMYINSGTAARVYNNTISLNSISTGTNFGATGIYYGTVTNLDLQNNIIRVNVTPAGTGFTAAVRRSSGAAGTPPSNLAFSSNKNIYYTPTATNSYLYAEGTTAAGLVNAYNLTNDPSFNTPCGLYKTFMAPRENATFTENNLVANGTLSGVFAPSGNSYAKNNSSSNPSISTDFYGVTRPAFPDAGAVQFTGTGTDAAGPLISYSPLPTTSYCLAPPTIVATITDPSGVNTTTGTKPRLYYKKASEANAFGSANTSAGNGWKWIEGTNVGNVFTFIPDYSLLTSAIGVNDSISYFIVAQDNNGTPNVTTVLASYPSGYCPSSVALTAAAGPLSTTLPSYGYRQLARPSFAIAVTPKSICLTATVKMNLNTPANGLTVRWQSKPLTGGSYTTIPGTGTGSIDSAVNVTSSSLFRTVFLCGGTVVDSTIIPDTVFVTSPQLLSAASVGRCGPGTITLNATAGSGNTINWYSSATGGAPIATGPSYTTPSLTSTTVYYVTSGAGTSYYNLGKTTPTSTSGNSGFSDIGLVFDAYQAFNIQSVDVYATGTASTSGSVTVALKDASGTTLQTATNSNVTVTSGGTTVTTVPLNFSVPQGANYRLVMTAASGISTLIREFSTGYTYPYTVPGVAAITAGYTSGASASYYYYFYNWQISAGCETPRRPDTAYIGTPVVNPTVAAQGPTTICNKDTAIIKASPTGAGFRYQWFRGTTALTGATDSIYKATVAGTYTASVFSVPGCGSTATNSVTITVNSVPTTVSPAGPLIVCTGNTDTLSGPTGTGLTYQWFNNNLLISGATARQLVISNSGNYKVRVTNTANGCSDTSSAVTVSVQGAPPATILAPNLRGICPGKSITLSTPAISGLAYQWRRNNTNIAGATGQTYVATLPGTYTLQVSAGRGCVSISDSVILTQASAPPTTVSSPTTNICGTGNSLTLTATTGTFSYQWLQGGTPITGATNYNYTVTTAGSYRLRITDLITGCVDTSAARNIQVSPLPVVATTPTGNQTICSLDSLNARAISATATRWQWSRNGTALPADTNSTYVLKSISGSYTVRVRDNAGCQSAPSTPINLTVNPSPTANITYTTPLTFCQGGGVVLNAQTEPGNRVQWITNGIAIQNDTLPYKNVMTSGSYSILINNSFNCSNSSPTIPVTVLPAPQPAITRNGLTLSVVNGPFSTYQWYRNNLPIAGATQSTYTATTNGGYAVRVTDANTCEATSSNIVIGTVSVVNTIAGQLKLYPNPTTSVLNIESPVAVRVVVRDVTGKTLLTATEATQVDLASFADGMYLVYVFDGSGQLLLTEKVTKTTAR